MRPIVHAVLLLCISGTGRCGSAQEIENRVGPITLTLRQTTPLEVIVKLASEQRAPVGIILGLKPSLCERRESINVKTSDLKEALSQLVVGTGYRIEEGRNLLVLTAPDKTERETRILNHRFDRFSATDSSMARAAALLNGYIMTGIDGAQGFAIDTLSGVRAKSFSIKMEKVTTEEIAAEIVSQDGRGLWVLKPTPETTTKSGLEDPIKIYSYDENADLLNHLTCSVALSEAK